MSDLIKQVKALEKGWQEQRSKADRAERKLHAVLEHHGVEEMYERLEVAEAAVKRLEAVVDEFLKLNRPWKLNPERTAWIRSET